MEKQGKVWGQTSCIWENNNVEIHRIECKMDGYCSTHKHEHKYNMFFVEKGKLQIEVWKKDYDLIDKTVLGHHEKMTVKPGEFHRFRVLEEGTVAYEIYWTQISGGDIVRKDHGGVGS